MNAVVADRIRGVIYGQAIGDALGLGTEFLSKRQVSQYYPRGLSGYHQIVRDAHRQRWAVGDWTDDTDQMLCILDSLLDKKKVDVIDIALRLHKWVRDGGMGVGQTVYRVVHSPDFIQNPHTIAQRVWKESGQRSASNGGVMRTSVLGIWEYQFPERVRRNAEEVCKITHYDPRCVGSCVAVSLAISSLLSGASDVENIIKKVAMKTTSFDPRIQEYLDKAVRRPLETFNLDEGLNLVEVNRIGYTLKTMSAGFWALKNAVSYSEGVLQIIHEGGDADSNAAVAGALLGARFGFSQIPRQWVDELRYEYELHSRVERLIELLGVMECKDKILQKRVENLFEE